MTTSSAAHKLDALSRLDGWPRLLAVIACLRNPEGGCPWDLKQTHQTLRPYMLEEAYEAVEAMGATDNDASKAICEELGDVLLQVVLNAQIAKDNGDFDINDVAIGIADKLIRRHPHVFSDVSVDSADEVTKNWQAIKQDEKANTGDKTSFESTLDGVSTGQPALQQALDTSKKAVAVGFEWPNFESLWACVTSELDEFLAEHNNHAPIEKLEDELGDILFASVNLARHHKINPEIALVRATQKFKTRFKMMEQLAQQRQPKQPLKDTLEALTFEEWDALWEEAKMLTNK